MIIPGASNSKLYDEKVKNLRESIKRNLVITNIFYASPLALRYIEVQLYHII